MNIYNSKVRLVSDPELDFVPKSGAPFIKGLNVAENYGYFKDKEWVDQGSGFWRVAAYDEVAKKLELLTKGTQIMVTRGTVTMKSYEKEGETVSTPQLQILEFFVV